MNTVSFSLHERPALRYLLLALCTAVFGLGMSLGPGLQPSAAHAAATGTEAAVVRLHNRDAKTYPLYVRHTSSAVHTSIGPKTITNICSGACSIELKGTGKSVQAKPGQTVVISGGVLRG